MTHRFALACALAGLVGLVAGEFSETWARAGGGGSRGSRSFSAPARPAPGMPGAPASPGVGRPAAPATAPEMARPGGFGRGLLGGLGGFMLGGLLGGLLFGGLGSGSGLGFGLFDLLLIGGGVFLLMAWMRRRREATVAPAPAYATAGGGTWAGGGTATAQPVDTLPEMPAALADLDRGVGHIRQMDPAFDPAALAASARTVFGQVQAAIGARDVAPLRDRIGPELFGVLKTQCDALRGGRRVNRVEGIDIREADVTEAWQESGRDYATVRLAGSLIDYTADEATGEVVKGSRSAQAFEEYWTFSRPVGPNRWVLGAIQTG